MFDYIICYHLLLFNSNMEMKVSLRGHKATQLSINVVCDKDEIVPTVILFTAVWSYLSKGIW